MLWVFIVAGASSCYSVRTKAYSSFHTIAAKDVVHGTIAAYNQALRLCCSASTLVSPHARSDGLREPRSLQLVMVTDYGTLSGFSASKSIWFRTMFS